MEISGFIISSYKNQFTSNQFRNLNIAVSEPQRQYQYLDPSLRTPHTYWSLVLSNLEIISHKNKPRIILVLAEFAVLFSTGREICSFIKKAAKLRGDALENLIFQGLLVDWGDRTRP